MASDVHTKFGSTHECGGLHFFFVDLQVFPQAVLVHSLFHPTPFSKRQALNHICHAGLPPCSRTVYIFLFLSMSVVLLKFPLVAIFVLVARARTFLNTDQVMGEFMSQSVVRESLVAELQHAVTHGPGEIKLLRLEAFLKPMYAALPKNGFGKLGVEAVSYALHRFFVERHGWHVKGLEPGARAEGVSPAASILKDRVPSYMESMVEEQLGGQGFGLHELAVLAASLEHLVHDDSIGRLQSVFEAHDLPLTGGISERLVDEAIDTYLMVYIQGGNLTGMTPKKLQAKQARLTKKDPSWRETRVWMRDIRRSVSYVARDRRNPFVDSGMSFGDAAHVVEEIGEQFGRWQDLECRSLKNILVDLDRDGTGRIPLSEFYRATLDGKSCPNLSSSMRVLGFFGSSGHWMNLMLCVPRC